MEVDAEDGPVRAAGGVVWRPGPTGGVEIVIVHRPRYDDWSLPKGKLDPGETWEQAAVREVAEETGYRVELGEHLGQVEYRARDNGDHRSRRRKVVRFWTMRSLGGSFTPDSEVDAIRWLPASAALTVLSYEHDRTLVRTFLQRGPTGTR